MGELKRRAPLKRSGRVRAVNRKRKRKADARNFGEEAKRVRTMRCAVEDAVASGALGFWRSGCKRLCCGRVRAAHVTARGMGAVKGGRFDLVPLCDRHHGEAGEAGTSQRADFEKRWHLDLRAEADRIAVEHPEPLGIRGLARRWAVATTPVLDEYEEAALLGWVRRVLHAIEPEDEHDVMVDGERIDAVAEALGLALEQAIDICEAAGWTP